MALPPVSFETRTVRLSAGEVEVRGLSYDEGQRVKGPDAVAHAIAAGTDTPLADTKAWMKKAPAGDVKKLMQVITEMSGFDEDAQFPDRPADVPGAAPAAE